MSGRSGRVLEARPRLSGGRRALDAVAAVVLLAAQICLAIAVGWAATLMSIGFGSCSSESACVVEAGAATALAATRYVLGAFVLLSAGFTIARLVRRRVAWAVPVFGIVAILALFAVVTVVVQGSFPD